MIDDPLDEYATRQAIYIAGTPRTGSTNHPGQSTCPGDIDPTLRGLLQAIEDEAQIISACWTAWNTDERHDAVNALHARWQEADNALMDAVRLTDFHQAKS